MIDNIFFGHRQKARFPESHCLRLEDCLPISGQKDGIPEILLCKVQGITERVGTRTKKNGILEIGTEAKYKNWDSDVEKQLDTGRI